MERSKTELDHLDYCLKVLDAVDPSAFTAVILTVLEVIRTVGNGAQEIICLGNTPKSLLMLCNEVLVVHSHVTDIDDLPQMMLRISHGGNYIQEVTDMHKDC